MVQIDFHPAATAELEESAKWYAIRSEAAAQRFAVAVDAALKEISDDPGCFARIDARHKACSVRKFPFQVIFRDE